MNLSGVLVGLRSPWRAVWRRLTAAVFAAAEWRWGRFAALDAASGRYGGTGAGIAVTLRLDRQSTGIAVTLRIDRRSDLSRPGFTTLNELDDELARIYAANPLVELDRIYAANPLVRAMWRKPTASGVSNSRAQTPGFNQGRKRTLLGWTPPGR